MTIDGSVRVLSKTCKDMCMINPTDKFGVDVDSAVKIFGKNNPIDDMAIMAELTCAVSKRVLGIYIENRKVVNQELLLRL